jgi:hypothetical protein
MQSTADKLVQFQAVVDVLQPKAEALTVKPLRAARYRPNGTLGAKEIQKARSAPTVATRGGFDIETLEADAGFVVPSGVRHHRRPLHRPAESASRAGTMAVDQKVLITGSPGTLADVPFAEQAHTAAPAFNLRQRRAIGAILAQDSGGQLHADLRKFTLGRVALGDYLHLLDGHIQILQNAFQQADLQVEADVVRQYVDLRSVLAL